jgi:acetyltransferase-like isoleucine patch superfamily enzyme
MSKLSFFYRYYRLSISRTFFVNFKYLPIRTAVLFPIWITRRVKLKKTAGTIEINGNIKPGMIQVGFNDVSISDKKERSLWNVSGKIMFNGSAIFGAGTKIAVGDNAILQLGKGFKITAKSEIACFKRISFGDGCLLSWDVLIMDTDAHNIYNLSTGEKINPDNAIEIGNHVWIGCRTLVLKGSKIADNSVVGANSLVTAKFEEPNVIVAGVPAKVVKKSISWA